MKQIHLKPDEAVLNLAAGMRHRLHSAPELSGAEYNTSETIAQFLSANTSAEVKKYDNWLYAAFRSKSDKPALAFRADIDAIHAPDGSPYHGCGHDGHAAALCGAALLIDRYVRDNELQRDIILIFQPAEETGAGAALVCDTLKQSENIGRIYGCHNIPGYPMGQVLLRRGVFACASLGLTVRAEGRQSHAAYPEEGLNPGFALCRFALALEERVKQLAQKGLVQATLINIDVGSKNFGISAGSGEISFTLRAEHQYALDELVNAAEALAGEMSAEGFGITLEKNDVFPSTCSDGESLEILREYVNDRGISMCELTTPMRWSEDFGNYLNVYKGAFFGVGSGEATCGLHTAGYEYPDGLLKPTAELIAGLMLSLQ